MLQSTELFRTTSAQLLKHGEQYIINARLSSITSYFEMKMEEQRWTLKNLMNLSNIENEESGLSAEIALLSEVDPTLRERLSQTLSARFGHLQSIQTQLKENIPKTENEFICINISPNQISALCPTQMAFTGWNTILITVSTYNANCTSIKEFESIPYVKSMAITQRRPSEFLFNYLQIQQSFIQMRQDPHHNH